jgi:hypothetical protein
MRAKATRTIAILFPLAWVGCLAYLIIGLSYEDRGFWGGVVILLQVPLFLAAVALLLWATSRWGWTIWHQNGRDNQAQKHLWGLIEELCRKDACLPSRILGSLAMLPVLAFLVATTLWPLLLGWLLWAATGYALPLDSILVR